eukprot:scaffold20439_cov136-Isochrysis_galbana.AAC.2
MPRRHDIKGNVQYCTRPPSSADERQRRRSRGHGGLSAALPRACAWALGAPDLVDGRLCDCLRGRHGISSHHAAVGHSVSLEINGRGQAAPGARAVQECCRVCARSHRSVARSRRHPEAHRSRPRCAIGFDGTGRR